MSATSQPGPMPHLEPGSEELELDLARYAHGGSPAAGDAAAQRAGDAQPRRGLITGLWSSATRLASFIGLPALPAEGPGGPGDVAFAPNRQAAAALQSEALGAWIGWYRHRAAKRRVVQELTNLRGDMVLRQHLTRWFEYCEHVSMTSPPTPPASMEHAPPTIKPWNPTLGVLAVATPPRVDSRPPASTGTSQGTAMPGQHSLLSPEPRRDSPRLSPRKVPLQPHPSFHLRVPRRHDFAAPKQRLPCCTVCNCEHVLLFAAQVKDMRPGAFAEQADAANEGVIDTDISSRRSASAPPSPNGKSSQLWPNANEPCPSSPKAGSIRTTLKTNIKMMKDQRLSWMGQSQVRDSGGVQPPSPMLSPMSPMPFPKPAVMNTQASSGGDETDRSSNSLVLTRCDSQSNADSVTGSLMHEDSHSHLANEGEQQTTEGDYTNGPSVATTRSPTGQIPILSRTPSPDRSNSLERSVTNSPDPDIALAKIEHGSEHEPEKGEGSVLNAEQRNLSIGAYISLMRERRPQGPPESSWMRADTSWRTAEDDSNSIEEGHGVICKDSDESDVSDETMAILSKDVERIRGLSFLAERANDYSLACHPDSTNVESSRGVPSPSTSAGRPPRPPRPEGRDLSTFSSAQEEEIILQNLVEELAVRRKATTQLETAEDKTVSCEWAGARRPCSQEYPGSRAGDAAAFTGAETSSDTPSPSGSKDLNGECTADAWDEQSEAEDDIFSMSISSPASPHWQVAHGSFTGSVGSLSPNASPSSALKSIIRSGSNSSINTFTGECIDSVLYEHEYKLSVRVMQVFKRLVHEKTILNLIIASGRERARRHYLAEWRDFAEVERQNYCALAFAWRAWVLSFQAAVNRLERAIWDRKRGTKRQTLHAWLECVMEHQADSFREEKALLASLHAWSETAEQIKGCKRITRFAIQAWRQWLGEHMLFQQEAVAAATRARLRTLLEVWADIATAMRSDSNLLRLFLGEWKSRQEEVKMGVINIKATYDLRACCDVVSAWSELVSDRKIEAVYGCIIHELMCEEAEIVVENLPCVVNFRTKISRRFKFQNLRSWRQHFNKMESLRSCFSVQHEKSNSQRQCYLFYLWLNTCQVSRSKKIRLMNPHTNIDVSQGLPSPRQLLRKANGSVEQARLVQTGMQVKLIQHMLSEWISEITACDLLERANGNTEQALEAAREAERMGLALQHFAQAAQFVVFKRWILAVQRAKTLMHATVTVKQQADMWVQGAFFDSWRGWLQHKDSLWHAQIAIREQHAHLNSCLHFCAWADVVPLLGRVKRFASRQSRHMQMYMISHWRAASLQSLCFSTSFEIVRAGRHTALRGQIMVDWARYAVSMRKKRELRRLVCSRHENVLYVFAFSSWTFWGRVVKHHKQCLSTIKKMWDLRERQRLLCNAYHAWSHEVEQHKVDRVLAMLDLYEADIQPQIRPLVTKCLEQCGGALGLKWKVIGSQRPKTGHEIKNAKLAKALEQNIIFSKAEFEEFGITSLSRTSYIQAGSPGNIKYLMPVGGSVQHAEMLTRGVILRERAQRISKLFHEDIGVDTATLLLERSKGNVDEAVRLAYAGVKHSIAAAYSIGSRLSRALEALKDFVYMFRAWRLLVRRAEMLPAKFCFSQWASQTSYYKSCYGKLLMLVSSNRMGRLKRFFAAWLSVCDYYVGLADSEKYLRNKAAIDLFYLWQLSVEHVHWRKYLLARLIKILNTWRLRDFFNVLKARCIFILLGRNIRLRYLKRNAIQALDAWLWVRSVLDCVCACGFA